MLVIIFTCIVMKDIALFPSMFSYVIRRSFSFTHATWYLRKNRGNDRNIVKGNKVPSASLIFFMWKEFILLLKVSTLLFFSYLSSSTTGGCSDNVILIPSTLIKPMVVHHLPYCSTIMAIQAGGSQVDSSVTRVWIPPETADFSARSC